MKLTKNTIRFSTVSSVLILLMISFAGCKKEKQKDELGEIKGAPGNPRFNLQFTNSSKVDLDLYVETPNGSRIYYGNQSAQKGQLDVDCLCGDCPTGPNENIYWVPGTAPSGTYKVWVEYYGDCDGAGSPSTFTLRIMNNESVLNTYTGTLTPINEKSAVYTLSF